MSDLPAWPPSREQLEALLREHGSDTNVAIEYGFTRSPVGKLRRSYGLPVKGNRGNPDGWRLVNARKVAAALAVERRCVTCNEVLVRRPKENSRDFLRRKACSSECSHKDLRKRRAGKGAKPTPLTVIPAASVEEWLRLNGGPTKCPTAHAMGLGLFGTPTVGSKRGSAGDGRVRG